ncbi:MAG: hypothetical protein OXU35_07905 [Acidobacteriota bacterium]|nr:hypothetical protein [Acidobacteriota bacterium]
MDERENESLAAGGRPRQAGPYTGPGNEEQDTLNGQVAATIRGLDRKLTDGLNLVHGQLDVMRHERLEDRRELRETRAELKAGIAAVEQKLESRCDGMEKKFEGRFDALERKLESHRDALEQKVEGRSAGLERSFENRSTGLERRFDGLEQRFDAFEQKLESRFDAIEAKFESRFASLEGAIRELTALTSTALERSLGTRRLVRGVLGAFALLLAGGLLRPVFERAVQALLGG